MIEKLFVFTKAQVSSFTGGIVDYLLMIFFTEIFYLHYTLSIAIGGVFGAIVNFLLNKKWTFHSKEIPYQFSDRKLILRFLLTVMNSILMKALGTYFITTTIKTDYIISRIIVDLIVSIVFNYTLQKHWVFKKKSA